MENKPLNGNFLFAETKPPSGNLYSFPINSIKVDVEFGKSFLLYFRPCADNIQIMTRKSIYDTKVQTFLT